MPEFVWPIWCGFSFEEFLMGIIITTQYLDKIIKVELVPTVGKNYFVLQLVKFKQLPQI